MDNPLKKQKLSNPLDLVFTNKDITTNYIIPNLSPLEVWATYQAYPRLNCNISFFDRFIQVLEKHFRKKKVTIDIINDANVALTGGFLLGILFNDYHQASDIDLLHIAPVNLSQYVQVNRRYLTDYTRVAYYEVLYPMINSIIDYDSEIQLIGINCDFKTYVNHFDLQFCSLYYNNKKLYTKSKKHDLIKKQFFFSPDVILYEVANHPTLSVSWLSTSAAERVKKRIYKYRQRGFEILCDRSNYYVMLQILKEKVVIDCPGNMLTGTEYNNETKETGRINLCNAIATYWSGFWDALVNTNSQHIGLDKVAYEEHLKQLIT